MTKQFKINPDLTCPELAGYRLPSFSRSQEDDLRKMAKQYAVSECDFISGYTKARKKYEFTEADMKYIFECGRNYQNNAEVTFKVSIDHLRTPRTPIAIEVEMAKPSESFGAFVGNSIGEFVPALNPDGTVKGRWVYE